MSDTQRSVAAILALLADNTSGAISPQDIRDAFVTWRNGCGQIYISETNSGAITIPGTVSYYECTSPIWTLGSSAYLFDESGGNGRLTYTGTVDVMAHIACTISFTCGSNNQTLHWALGVTGVLDESCEVHNKLATGADVQSTAMHLITTLSQGDYVSLWVRNTTGANNVTLTVANLQAVTMPM